MVIEFIVPGECRGKSRPRMSTKTGRAYTPKETIQYENLIKLSYINQIEDGRYIETPVKASIAIYTAIPKSFSKKKREEAVIGRLRPGKKPDLDNVAKIVLDSLNGIAYKDDCQVVELVVTKHYAEVARVEVKVEEL